MIPDLLVDWGATARLPIDAKYKLYDDRKTDAGDRYQAFLYATAYADVGPGAGLSRALLIYPSTQASVTHRQIQVRRSGGTGAAVSEIGVVGVPIAAMLDEPTSGLGPCCSALAAAIGQPLAIAQRGGRDPAPSRHTVRKVDTVSEMEPNARAERRFVRPKPRDQRHQACPRGSRVAAAGHCRRPGSRESS